MGLGPSSPPQLPRPPPFRREGAEARPQNFRPVSCVSRDAKTLLWMTMRHWPGCYKMNYSPRNCGTIPSLLTWLVAEEMRSDRKVVTLPWGGIIMYFQDILTRLMKD